MLRKKIALTEKELSKIRDYERIGQFTPPLGLIIIQNQF